MQRLAQNETRRNSNQADSDAGIIAEWPLKRHERLRVSLELFNGVWLINSRKWFQAENGEWRPGKQGIALGVKHLPQTRGSRHESPIDHARAWANPGR